MHVIYSVSDFNFQYTSIAFKADSSDKHNNYYISHDLFLYVLQHFKLGDYSFQIKAYEPENNTLHSQYRFKKPITITLVYDVNQMLKQNKKVISDDVTNEDIDPVLLLWDTKNQTWYL